MLAQERHRRILSRIERAGSVRVAPLARELKVTEETIRRDLERLDAAGKLLRTHGGALTVGTDRRELPLRVRETVRIRQKRAIALHAARRIEEGDVVVLDASSTAHELARAMPDLPVTVVTNSLAAALAMADRTRVRVVLTGGVLDWASRSLLGPQAEQSLERFRIRKAFISCQGIDLERGLSVTADEHAGIKRRMMDLAEEVYLLADSSKFGVRAVEFFAPVTEVDVVITDAAADGEMIAKLAALGVRVETAG